MSVVVITPPAEIVSLATAKAHLRVTTPDEDSLIRLYLAAAQAMIDGPGGWLGRAVGQQTLELRLDDFAAPPIWSWSNDETGLLWDGVPDVFAAPWPRGSITLPCPPLIDVTSVTYEDATGATQALPSADYLASDEGLQAAFGTVFPSGRWEPNAVRIRYQAGYPDVPAPIIAAVLLMTGDLYDNRQTVETGVRAAAVTVPMSTTVEALLGPYRVFG